MGRLFEGPKTPPETPPVKMPDPEDPEVTEAARRRRRMAISTGRDATRLAAGGDLTSSFAPPTAAAPPAQTYTKTTLG
jgi:hypothetical protein